MLAPKFPIPNVNSICFKHICQWLGLSVLLCRALQLLAVNIIKFISNRLYYLPNHHPYMHLTLLSSSVWMSFHIAALETSRLFPLAASTPATSMALGS